MTISAIRVLSLLSPPNLADDLEMIMMHFQRGGFLRNSFKHAAATYFRTKNTLQIKDKKSQYSKTSSMVYTEKR